MTAERAAAVSAAMGGELRFQRRYVSEEGTPRPRVPMLPVAQRPLSALMRAWSGPLRRPGVQGVFLTSGADALMLALRASGAGEGTSVAMPAYHCPKVVEAALAIGARPVLYGVTVDLSPDLSALEAALVNGVRAVVVIHYFAQPVSALQHIADLCRRYGAALIEDCAHCDPAAHGLSYGLHGDFSAYSVRKFYAVPEGGWVVPRQGAGLPRPRFRPGPASELKALYRWLEEARPRGAGAWVQRAAQRAVDGLRRACHRSAPVAPGEVPETGRARLRPGERLGSRVAERLWLSADTEAARSQRWRNHERLTALLAAVPGVRPVPSQVPQHAAPYVVLAQLEAPGRQYPALKRAGVPVWRWDQLYEGECPVPERLALGLVQFPCHQGLRRDDVEWIAARVAAA